MNQKYNLKNLPTLLPHNIDWARFFNNDHPLDLEIGCGRPHFFFDRVVNFPHRNIVGIEWVYEFMHQAQARIMREGFTNAHALHGNAWALVPLLFKNQSIEEVFVNFPDPWWKTRHKKRLVLNSVFLDVLASRVKEDGCIVLQTDVAELFWYYQELMNSHGAFIFDDKISLEEIASFVNAKTHREKKCLEHGLPIYRGVFRKR